ncbi:MAG: ATP-binding protein [Spirochaetaceae bacterium]|nr:ATP-binding protein [Spirochaetaceae bacterium]
METRFDLPERGYCFTAIVGQEDMKTALLLNAINPRLGGVLIRGEKGTAKSTAVRALAELLPPREQVSGCRFNCDPRDTALLCPECAEKLERGETLENVTVPMQVIDLPVSATEDRVVGALDMEHAVKTGEKRFETGILARANRNILYVDEVNLLEDHVVDVLLDSAAMGVNTVEREGVSYSHPARFILVGTMNPEEGDLRPQLIDRFGLSVTVTGEGSPDARIAVMENRLKFENNPGEFFAGFEEEQEELREKILRARELLPSVVYTGEILKSIVNICIKLKVDGHRADIGMLKTAMTLAAFRGRREVWPEDVRDAAKLVLPHRMRRKPFEETGFDINEIEGL